MSINFSSLKLGLVTQMLGYTNENKLIEGERHNHSDIGELSPLGVNVRMCQLNFAEECVFSLNLVHQDGVFADVWMARQ